MRGSCIHYLMLTGWENDDCQNNTVAGALFRAGALRCQYGRRSEVWGSESVASELRWGRAA